MRERDHRDVTSEVDEIYDEIRNNIIDKVTVRRTRNNIKNDPDYNADLEAQKIKFPEVLPPNELIYQMDSTTSALFYKTLTALSKADDNVQATEVLSYARYRAIEFLTEEYRGKKYKNAEQIAQTLAGIYRVHMVKRLESSFHAFKKSLHTLLRITSDMIEMFEADNVIIAPELNVKSLQAKGWELDQILEYAAEKGYQTKDISYPSAAFKPEFIEMLNNDKRILEQLSGEWEQVVVDPKFDLFKQRLENELMSPAINPTGKLVLFSDSVDTLTYLYDRLKNELGLHDVLMVTAANREKLRQEIRSRLSFVQTSSPVQVLTVCLQWIFTRISPTS